MFLLKSLFRLRENMQINSPSPKGEMPFLDHLEDLRRTLIRMLVTAAIAMAACLALTPQMMDLLRRPVEQVRLRYEQEHLPSAISYADWQQARQLAAVLPLLSPQAKAALESQYHREILRLATLPPLLQAASMLPQKQQEHYLQQCVPPDLLPTAQALRASKAQYLPDRDTSNQLMGAFQPGEAFMISLSLAFFGGLLLSSPLLLSYLLQFIIPGLHEHERKLLYKSLAAGVGLFLAGCVFAYLAVLPRVLGFFYRYSLDMGIANDWRIGYYLTFATKFIFLFGIIFELPVVIIPFIRLGLLTYPRMKRTRAYALIACLAMALILAPAPDPATMLLMALPMYLLYELCILFARANDR